jgi:hypothetical protein
MADLTTEQAIEKLRNLPEEKQQKVLLGLPPAMRKGILDQLRIPQTAGEKYMAARRAGNLPRYEAPPSFMQNPQAALAHAAGEAGALAQKYQTEAQPIKVREGKVQGTPGPGGTFTYETKPFLEQVGRGAQSMFYEGVGVAAQLAGGLMDPKTLAVFVLSKLTPAGMLAAASYFGYQSSQQVAEAIRTGNISPENAQRFLLGLAGMVGSAGMAGEQTPASIKERLATARTGAQRVARQVTGPEAALRDEVRASAEKYAKDVPENKAKLEETIKENKERLQSSRFREGEQKFQLQKTNKEIEAENARKLQEAEAAKVQRKASHVKVEEQSKQAKEKIENVENAVWKEANRKFEAVKEKIGADKPGEPLEPAAPLLEAVNVAQNNILRGIPETVPIFRSILKLDEETSQLATLREQVMQGQGMTGRYADLRPEQKAVVDDIAQRYGTDVSEAQPVTWGKLQRIKTAADTAIRARGTQPIIKEALSGVRDTVVDMMGRMAESRGATAEWQDARKFYSEWRDDFHKRTGPRGSASPIAQTLDAVDSKYIRESLLRTEEEGTGDNRAVDILRKYPQFGGTEAADLVQQMSETKKGIIKPSGEPKLKPTKPVPEGPTLRPPELKSLPQKVPKPEVDAAQVARKALEQKAKSWGAFNARDIGIIASSVLLGPIIKMLGVGELSEGASNLLPYAAIAYEGGKYVASRALRNPQVISWLEKAPPEEIRALSNIPGADKVKIINGITESAVETLGQMDFSTDNTAFDRAKQELGPDAKLSDISKRAAQLNADAIRGRQQRFDLAKGRGKAVNLTPEVRAFLGPRNVARILAAAAAGRKEPSKPVIQNRRQALDALGRQPAQ